jgi:hypothetical protein
LNDLSIKKDVAAFLNQLKGAIILGRIIYAYRTEDGKNEDLLLEFGWVPIQRDECIKNLKVEDYSEGPTKDGNGGNDLWIFGLQIYNKEIYIKLQLTKRDDIYCISFHKAKYTMTYPLK